jgi:FKBP-type peptidyl-prolyl cis-trans isomerase
MKHASTLPFLFLLLAACGDSKPDPKKVEPAKPASTEVASKPTEPVATTPAAEPSATPAAGLETQDAEVGKWRGVADNPPPSGGEEPKKPVEEPPATPVEEKKPTEAKKSGDSPAKTADAPAAAAPAKVEELSVQVLQEGTGAVVKRGDTVTLEYTISYMPKPAAEKKDEKKKDTKGAKKPDAKKTDDKKDEKKSEDAKPKDEPKEGDKPADDKKEAAAKDESHAEGDKGEKSAEKPAEKNGEKSGDKPEEKPAEPKPGEPLKPVIVASTKSFTTPFTVKLTEQGKPKLMPGLVRGVEGLKVGTRARILVPAALAYGKEGNKSAGIPPETPVEIEVLIKDARE